MKLFLFHWFKQLIKVSGHKDGALSSSQGTGGKSQAQAQVEVDEKTGATSSNGQTSGLQHSSQSEVVANEKGGLADAQSSGPGIWIEWKHWID